MHRQAQFKQGTDRTSEARQTQNMSKPEQSPETKSATIMWELHEGLAL